MNLSNFCPPGSSVPLVPEHDSQPRRARVRVVRGSDFLVCCSFTRRLGWVRRRVACRGDERLFLPSSRFQILSGTTSHYAAARARVATASALSNPVLRSRVVFYLGLCLAIPSSQALAPVRTSAVSALTRGLREVLWRSDPCPFSSLLTTHLSHSGPGRRLFP